MKKAKSKKLSFVRKYTEKPYSEFQEQEAIDLADKVFNDHIEVPRIFPEGLYSVGKTRFHSARIDDLHATTQFKVGFINNKKKRTVALVGKGVLFDTGGYNVKYGNHMHGMKFDKFGAITALAVFKELKKLKNPKVNYLVITPFVANLIGPDGMVPGDVIEYDIGKKTLKVEVTNTDGEGRLILADGILEAQVYEADTIITIATLTGAISYALGDEVIGVFSNDELLAYHAVKTFNKARLDAWHMPILKRHHQALEHENKDVADIISLDLGSKGGSSTAAAFLEKFVHKKGTKFLHLDVAGIAWKKGKANDKLVKPLVKLITSI